VANEHFPKPEICAATAKLTAPQPQWITILAINSNPVPCAAFQPLLPHFRHISLSILPQLEMATLLPFRVGPVFIEGAT